MEGGVQNKSFDISWITIFRIAVVCGILYFLFLIQNILGWFLFALIISVLFNPAINFLQKKRVPRVMASILMYFGVFLLLGLLVYKIAPPLVSELRFFVLTFPDYFEKALPVLRILNISTIDSFQNFLEILENIFLASSANIFSALGVFFGGILKVFAIFSIAFFISLEGGGVEKIIVFIAPKQYQEKFLSIWTKVQKNISLWFATRIIGAFYVGTATVIACYVLDVRYFALFGLLAGISDIIVAIGPLFAGFLITAFIAITSLPKALIFLLVFILIQQIEGQIILPLLSKKFLRMSPVLVLASILIGSKIWGLLGAVLAIPLAGMLFEFFKGVFENKEKSDV